MCLPQAPSDTEMLEQPCRSMLERRNLKDGVYFKKPNNTKLYEHNVATYRAAKEFSITLELNTVTKQTSGGP